MTAPRVQFIRRQGAVDYYRVATAEGRPPVTVRVGIHGVFACLTCSRVDCEHAQDAREFAERQAAGAGV